MTLELDDSNYGAVRVALGFAGDDTTSLADATIESVQFLPTIEAMVSAAVAAETADCGEEDDLPEVHVQTALVYLTAAEIASIWLYARERERVKRQSVGGTSVDYADTNWLAVAAQCRQRGVEALARACSGAASVLMAEIASGAPVPLTHAASPIDGKTAAELSETREKSLVPWVMGGP